MKPLTIGVLGLQGDVEEHEHILGTILDKKIPGSSVQRVKTVNHADAVHGLVIPGGESTTIGILGQQRKLLDTIRTRISNGLPALGTCAGLILLANRVYDKTAGETKQSLIGGLDVTVERNSFGRQRESFEADLSIPILGEAAYRGIFIRSPVIKNAGPKTEVIAKISDNAIVAVRQGNIIGTSFHPELSGDPRLHEYFIQLVSRNPLLS